MLRDKDSYDQCLATLALSNQSRQRNILGIKGPTVLSQSINILEDVLYDYMHLCCEGYLNRFLNLITNSSSHRESYYIGILFSSFTVHYLEKD